MFLSLLGITFIVSLAVCFNVAKLFAKPIDGILERIVANDIAYAWTKYLKFAIYVVGIFWWRQNPLFGKLPARTNRASFSTRTQH